MEDRSIKIRSGKNRAISINVIPGHFATNHSHINYYIDMTGIKYRLSKAMEAGGVLAEQYSNSTPVDTIICMDGCEIIGGFMAQSLSRAGGMVSMNHGADINVITPEFNSNGQLIFRDNVQSMVWGKNVILLVASTTTGKTINRSLECIKYYGGKMQGIAAIFSNIEEQQGIPVNSIFTTEDIPNYHTYPFEECPDCKEQRKIDAIVNSYGYSRI